MAIITLSNHIQGYTIMSLALAMMVQHANQLNAQNPARITTDLLPKEQAEKMTAVITEHYLRQIAQKHGIEIEMRVQPCQPPTLKGASLPNRMVLLGLYLTCS